jgi:hypothetical protein
VKIYKWSLAVTDEQTLELPLNARILSVQLQHGQPQLWALIDEHQPRKQSRRIAIYGTENPIPDSPGEYIDTFQMHKGELVFHVFER